MQPRIRTLLGALLLLTGPALAQVPSTLPKNTVVGRGNISAGPPQAIPFATLFSAANVQPVSANLTALLALGSTGFPTRTGTNTWAQRLIAGTSNEITVTNGNGVSGNPTVSLPSAITLTGKTLSAGTFSGATLSGTTTLPGSGVITSGGLIGIGATPSGITLFHAKNGDASGAAVRLENTNSASSSNNYLVTNDSADSIFLGSKGSLSGTNGVFTPRAGFVYSNQDVAIASDTAIKFGTGTSYPDRMHIDSSGNVGIGTAAPSTQFHTTGGVRFATLTCAGSGGTVTASATGVLGCNDAAAQRTALGLGSIATQAASSITVTGGTMSSVAFTGGTVTNLPDPTANTDAANKQWVLSVASGLVPLGSSRLATAAVLPNSPTYANGASGVGATLTAGSNTTLTVDGSVAALNDVVLVKDQASALQNGQYYVSTVGSGAAAWVLTRCTAAACGVKFDNAATMLVNSHTAITAGSTNANRSYILSASVATVGTDAANFVLYASNGSPWNIAGANINYVAGNVGIGTVPSKQLHTTGTVRFSGVGLGTLRVDSNGDLTGTSPIVPTGLVGDGTTNDAAAIQAALDTHKPVYLPEPTTCYRITTGLTVYANQLITGAGRNKTKICVDTVLTTGALICSGGEPGPIIQDIGIYFTQPDTSTRASLTTTYTPGIYCPDTPRVKLLRIRISNAMTAIDLTGNAGGAIINDAELSAYNYHIKVDGALDTVRFTDVHIWNFDMTANQRQIFYESATIGIEVGRVDGLFIDRALFICGTQLNMHNSASGEPWVFVSNSGFDSFNGIVMSGTGKLKVINSYSTLDPTRSVQSFKLTGGTAQFTNFEVLAGPTAVSPIELSGSSAKVFAGTNLLINRGAIDTSMISISGSGGTATLADTWFNVNPSAAFTTPAINVTVTNRITLMGNRAQDTIVGTNKFINVPSADFHVIIGNMAPGWTCTMPAAPAQVLGNSC